MRNSTLFPPHFYISFDLGEVTEFTSGGDWAEIFVRGGENFDVPPPCRRCKLFGAPPLLEAKNFRPPFHIS